MFFLDFSYIDKCFCEFDIGCNQSLQGAESTTWCNVHCSMLNQTKCNFNNKSNIAAAETAKWITELRNWSVKGGGVLLADIVCCVG